MGDLINDEITELFFDEDKMQESDEQGNIIQTNTELMKYEKEKNSMIGQTMKDLDESIRSE
jgi:hypothetical protein